jgi:hypothetical protein
MNFLLIILCCILFNGNIQPALASIHAYPISTNQIMYRSQQSLRDSRDSSWQLVLYKTVKFGQVETLHLRLVGFPGLAEIAHPENLQITTANDKVWEAEDALINSSFPANVGEYDFIEVMKQLDREMPLWLTIPLKGVPSVELVVPPFAVKEWIQLLDKQTRS